MAINNEVYPNVYQYGRVNENTSGIPEEEINQIIKTSYCIAKLADDGNLSFDTFWQNSNCYAGFDPSVNNCYVGAAVVSSFAFDTSDNYQTTISRQNYNRKINYRIMARWGTQSGINPRHIDVRWTNIPDDIKTSVTAYHPETNAYSPTVYNSFTRSEQSVGGSQLNSQNTFLYGSYPVTNIPFQNVIFSPSFQIQTVTVKYDDETDITKITSIVSNSQTLNWADVKPEDQTPAGTNYDDDLYHYGIKYIYDTDGRLSQIIQCRGANLKSYFGYVSSDYTANGYENVHGRRVRLETTQGNADITTHPVRYNTNGGGATNASWFTLFVCAEIYDEILDSVVYTSIPGIANYYSGGTCSSDFFDERGYFTIPANDTGAFGIYEYISPFCSPTINTDHKRIQKNNLGTDAYVMSMVGNTHAGSAHYNPENPSSEIALNGNILTRQNGRQIYPCYSGNYYSIEELWQTLASFGMYIAADDNTAVNAQTTNVNTPLLYMGNMSEDGVTDGTMIQGTDINDLPQHTWTDINDTPYKPIVPSPDSGDEDSDKDSRDMGTIEPAGSDITLGATNGFVTYYALTASQIKAIGKNLWGNSNPADMLKNFFFYQIDTSTNYELSYAEIIDYFVGLKYYPFNIPSYATTEATGESGIRIGTGVTLIDAGLVITTNIITNPIAVIDGGKCTLPGYYNSFMDHEPIVTASLYVPFCGTTDIQPSVITGKTLYLKYYVDMVSGCCIAIVTMEGVDGQFPIAQLNGVMGFDMMLTGNNHNQQMANILGALGHTGISALSSITGAITSGAAETALAGISSNMASAYIDMPKTAALHPLSIGGSSSLATLSGYRSAFVQLRRKNSMTPSTYAHTVGCISNKTYKIADLSGYTVCINPDLSGIQATTAELDMLQNILQSGFYA